MGKPTTLFIALIGLIYGEATSAHHGFTVHYDVATQVRIEGTIHEVRYKNPHSVIRVLVTSEYDDDVIWTCETQAKSLLVRKGITADRFPIGEPIVIEGSKARRNDHGCEIGSMHLPDGSVVTVRSSEGRANIAVNTEVPAASAHSIFGNWVRDSFDGAPVTPGFDHNISDEGRAANAGYDGASDDPTLDCSPANPVRAMFAPGSPSEIRREDNRVVIRHEFMDTTRLVFLGQADRPPSTAPDEMGVSTGHFADDQLTVDTRNFSHGVLLTHVGDSGVLHSKQMTLREVFSVDANTGHLIYRWEAIDPLYFTAPIGGQLALSPTKLDIGSFDCQPQG